MEEVSLWSYLVKVVVGLGLMGAVAFGVARFLPRFVRLGSSSVVKVLSVTPVGRDLLYLFRVGPSVFAVLSSPKGGFQVLNVWDAEDFSRSIQCGGDEVEP